MGGWAMDPDAQKLEDMDLDTLMAETKPQTQSRPQSSLLYPHPPPSDGIPRCETPALQQRAMTPILSELQFKEGAWKDKLCGHHRMEYRSGNVYNGEWGWGDFHGKGCLEEADGCFYDGEWFEGKRNGQGKQRFADGSEYEGTWEDDIREGSGTHTNAKGDKYEGSWKDNKRNGKGTCTYSTGNVYTGDWVDNNKHGFGNIKWVDGDSYKGGWSHDKMHGNGTFEAKDGKSYSGVYHKGNFVKRLLSRGQPTGPRAATPGQAPYGMAAGQIPM